MYKVLVIDNTPDLRALNTVVSVFRDNGISDEYIDHSYSYNKAVGLVNTNKYGFIVLVRTPSVGRVNYTDVMEAINNSKHNKKTSIVYMDSSPSGRSKASSLLPGKEVLTFDINDSFKHIVEKAVK